MTESLARLLLRLSEGGEPAILWGTEAGPHLGPDFDWLLNRRVLIERAPATEWPVCPSCECELEVRPVQRSGNVILAPCPINSRRDVLMEEMDLRSFWIDQRALVREISTASDLGADLAEVTLGLWQLGTVGRTIIFLATSIPVAIHAATVTVLQSLARGARIALLAPRLTNEQRQRLAAARIRLIVLVDAIGAAGGSVFALENDILASDPAFVPRLVIWRGRKRISFDGSEGDLSPRPFELMHLLATRAKSGGGIVRRSEIEAGLWGTAGVAKEATADAIRDLRRLLKRIPPTGPELSDLIVTRQGQGYILELTPDEIFIET